MTTTQDLFDAGKKAVMNRSTMRGAMRSPWLLGGVATFAAGYALYALYRRGAFEKAGAWLGDVLDQARSTETGKAIEESVKQVSAKVSESIGSALEGAGDAARRGSSSMTH